MWTFTGAAGTAMQNVTSLVMLSHHHNLKAQQVHSPVNYSY